MTTPPDPDESPAAASPIHASATDGTGGDPRQLYHDLALAAQEIRLLDHVLAAVTAASDQDTLIRTVGFGLKELLPYERWSRVSLALFDDDRGHLQSYQLIGERNNPFWDNVAQGIQAAARDFGVETTFAMATMHSDVTQDMLIDQAIGDGVSGIALAPADAAALEPAIGRARQADIPLITFGTPPVAGSAALADIGTDNLRAGRLAGQAMARLLPRGGTVGLSIYSSTQINMRQRVQGFQETAARSAIATLPPVEIHDDRELGARLAREILEAHPDLAGAFGAASLNGPIWARAAAEVRRAGQVKIVGFDLVPATVALLKEGRIHATVVQREYDMGYRSVETLCQLIAGGLSRRSETQAGPRVVETDVDVVTLERTPWSIALADYLKHPHIPAPDRATVEAVARRGQPIRLLLIGILPKADPDIAQQRQPLRPGSLAARVAAAGQSQIVDPQQHDDGAFAEARARGVRTLVGVPLLARRRVVGMLRLESLAAGACAPSELAMLERVANAVVVALENARLFRQAIERQRALEDATHHQELLIQTILDLSSPVAPIAPGILVMPMVGTIDTRRASRFIETLLGAISAHDAQIVLIDISAVAVVDTSVANAIIQAGQAARMLGAEMVLVGITPAVAQTMVHLGIALTQMTTRADLESGFAYALARLKRRIVTVQ